MASAGSKPKAKKKQTFVAVVGISGPDGERYEAGDKVPEQFVDDHKWLVKKGKVK